MKLHVSIIFFLNVDKSKTGALRKGGKSKPGKNWHIKELVLKIMDQII